MLPATVDVGSPSFGVKGDGTTDDAPSLQAAIASAPQGGTVVLGPNTYRLGASLVISKQVTLVGAGGAGDYAPTALVTDGTFPAVVFQGNPGGWASLRDVAVRASAKVAGVHGVKVRAHGVRLDGVNIQGYGGNGIDINADDWPGGSNANNWRVSSCRVVACGGHGLYVRGSDANAGLCDGSDFTANAGWGIRDESLAGNTYVASMVEANVGGALYAANAGGSIFLGCYTEGGQPPSHVAYPGAVIGGTHGAGFDAGSTAFMMLNSDNVSPHRVRRVVGGKTLTHTLGNGEPFAASHVAHTDDELGMYAWAWDGSGYGAGRTNKPPALRLATDGHLDLPQGFTLGGLFVQPATAPRVWASNGCPLLAIDWPWLARKGDMVLDASGQSAGWYCNANCGSGHPWGASSGGYAPGATTVPTTRNGYVYRVRPESTSTVTGPTEPAWPTTPGATVADGGVLWECWGRTDSGLRPIGT